MVVAGSRVVADLLTPFTVSEAQFSETLACPQWVESGHPPPRRQRPLRSVRRPIPASPFSAKTCRWHDTVSNEPMAWRWGRRLPGRLAISLSCADMTSMCVNLPML